MAMTISVVTGYDDDAETINETLPAVYAVCDDCEGHGYVLNESMRHYCYGAAEFHDAFNDEDDRAAYFQRGGKYDVVCPTCKGRTSVLTIDRHQCTSGLTKEILERYDAFQDELDRQHREDAQTYRMESGIW